MTAPRASIGALSSAEFLPQRVSLLYRLSGNDVPAILVTSAIAAFALWGYISDKLLAAWLIWLVLASLVRIALKRAYHLRQPGPEAAARWEGFFCLTSASVGTVWGLTVLLLYPEHGQFHEILLPFLIGSVAMGLPPALAPSPKSFACLIAPIFTPLIGLLFSQGGAFNTSAGILILVFSAVLLALYLSSNRALIETLRFGRENERLLEQVKDAKDRLDLALQAANILIWDWDARRTNVFLGGNWGIILRVGKETSALTLDELAQMVHPDDLPKVKKALDNCLNGGESEYVAEHRVKTLAGSWVWSLSRGRVVERDAGGRALRMTGVNVDIDDRKRAEGELLAAVQREKELSEMKSKFVSTASHEFRTPLATMLSSAELLEHYSESLSPAERANLLQTIQGGAKRMGEMIDDVLSLGRAESGVLKLNLGPTNLRELCSRVVSEFRIAQGKQHIITLDDRFDRPEVTMDERLLRHILNNLLSNAVKYSPPGSEVTFSLSRRDEQAAIEIQDRGIGIPLEDQPRMFESFHRASNVENRPGTGLGLAIVKKAVELHGGEIGLSSAVGSGTRFTVMIPLRPAKQPAGAN
ncbi:MAG: PAS domain S-box protein [Betaproteobacteria bacterium]|nr:MAG: PAS domain S-box protein [Betaproteobacteria bacterium]